MGEGRLKHPTDSDAVSGTSLNRHTFWGQVFVPSGAAYPLKHQCRLVINFHPPRQAFSEVLPSMDMFDYLIMFDSSRVYIRF